MVWLGTVQMGQLILNNAQDTPRALIIGCGLSVKTTSFVDDLTSEADKMLMESELGTQTRGHVQP